MGVPKRQNLRMARERAWLEGLYRRYHWPRYIEPDPLQYPRAFDALPDREVVAVVASALAYGNVKAMGAAIDRVLACLGASPAATLAEISAATLRRRFRGFRYRFTDARKLTGLLTAIGRVQRDRGALANLVATAPDEATVVPALGRLASALRDASPCPLDHLVPHPDGGSACKRMLLLLRWMGRIDRVDPGGWTAIDPTRLVMPLDTHVYRVAHERGWTRRRTPDLRAALEITDVLRAIRPDDPLRYDFAITRPGIRRARTMGA